MPNEYFPQNDRELKDWFTNFLTVLSNNLAQVGLVAADITQLDVDSNAFIAALDNYIAQQTLLASASGQKKETKETAIASLRPIVRRIQNHPGMTDGLRGLLGLPIRTSTVQTSGLMPPDVPGIWLETEPGSVAVHFGTEPTNEHANGKPVGVKGCNIYRMKAGETDYQLVAYQSASPYIDTIDGNGADHTYVVRYRGNKASDLGQASPPMTIAARGALVQAA